MNSIFRIALLATALSTLVPGVAAKDEAISVDQCPAPVQAVIRQYTAQGTFESVTLDEKKKTGGPAVYEAKFNLRSGKRVEVHILANGNVVQIEEKKPKS